MFRLSNNSHLQVVHESLGNSYPHTTLYTALINFLCNCLLSIHVQPEDGYCWKVETCSFTLGSNVNTPLLSNKQVVLD